MQNNLCPQCQSPIPADAPGGICPGCALLGVSLPTSPTQVAGASVPMLDEVAAAFPELEVLELYGQGGMGAVFKARQPKLDRFVALKILTPALATQPGFAERFTREARALAKLSHPNIVGVHDFGESGGFFYLLMEFVDGVNLRQAMRAGVTPEQALLLVPKVCEALQFAHDHGVLHRDIKPENILLDTHGVPKLADFGIAKFGDDKSTGLTMSGMQLGTAAYMAPEQIEQPATVDHRADIYSLGVVLYEMLTGELPLGRFAAPSEKSHCSGGVDDVVLRALEKQRERRQQSATEMKTQVEGAATRNAAPPPPPATARRSACYLCTPEHLRSVACNIYIYTAKGHVALDAHTLTFVGDGESVTIPLRSIRELGIGHYPALAKPIRLDFLSIVWEENGALRTRLFTPNQSGFSPAWTTNSVVAEWAEAVRTGARSAQGRDIPFTATCALGTRPPSTRTLFTFGMFPIALSLIPLVIILATNTGDLSRALLAFLGTAIGVAVVWMFIKAFRSDPRAPSLQPTPAPPRDAPFSKAAAAGALLAIGSIPFGLIVFLIVKAFLNPSFDRSGQMEGPIGGNIIIFGFIPAFIGVALGWKAVGDFRYHRGHLRGGGTAVFAALGIPVFAVIVTALVNFEDIDRAINPLRIGSSGILVASLVVLAAFAASIWAVRALWRFVHSGPPGVPVPQRPVHHVQPSSIPAVTGVPFEYRSPRQWLGMPLVHIVRGRDPLTGKIPVARGVIAIGARAHGIVAVGVLASGGLAIGSMAVGVFSVGALAVGILACGAFSAGVLALGSMAIGFVSALGGLAIGDIAKGTLAIGRYYTEGVTRIHLDSLWKIVSGLLLVAIGAWSAMFPGFREIRRTTDVSRPWSPAGFRAVIGTLTLLALIMVTFFVPNLPTFQAARPVPPSFTVAFPGDIIRPGSQGMVIGTTMPYGYMVDFTFFVRDAEGTVEIPELGCTFAARNPPAANNGKAQPRIPIEAKWALKPADASSPFPYLRFEGKGTMPANSGWWRNGSGTYNLAERYRKFRWEPHPERPKQTPFINFGIVPFIRGTGMTGTEPVGAEMFLRVEARPLGDDEPVPEYTVFDNIPREQRLNRLRAYFGYAERHPEYLKRKAELDSAEARLKAAGDNSPEAASLKREVRKAQNRAWFLREELAVPQTGENLAETTPALIAVKIKIADLNAQLRDFYEDPPSKPANAEGTQIIIETDEIKAARKELEAAKAERMELLKKGRPGAHIPIERSGPPAPKTSAVESPVPMLMQDIETAKKRLERLTSELAALDKEEEKLLETFFPTHEPIIEINAKKTALRWQMESEKRELDWLSRVARNPSTFAPERKAEIAIEDERIRIAKENLATEEQRLAAGVATPQDINAFELRLIIEQARGDKRIAAEAQLLYFQTSLADTRKRAEVGVVGPDDVRKAELAVAEAKAELEKLRSVREPGKP